jgi:zinc and cadmium transporter
MNLKQVILVSSLGAMFSLLGCILLFIGTKHNRKIIHLATPFAAGALLSAVFLDLLKDGLEYSLSSTLLLSVLVGILLFFLAERFLDWFHHNHESLDSKRDPSIPLIIVGNGMHNALDGVAIAAAFLINVPTGIVTTFAVAIHEVPHNAADFGLLVHKNLARARALIITMLSNFATVIVAVIVYSLGTTEALPVGVLLGLSAGFLLYIALSDIIPDIHDHASNRALFDSQVIMLLMGVIVVGFAIEMTHILVT